MKTLLLLLLTVLPGLAQTPLLRADGPKIVDAQNREVLLQGMNLGGWLLQEGYMMKPGYGGTQGSVKKVLYQAGMSDAAVERFYQRYRDNFITKADINFIAQQGFNCIRLPLHYDLFLTRQQRAVRNGVIRGTVPYAEYVDKLKQWQQAGQLFQKPAQLEAIRIIDKTLAWCAANKLYVVLDLHAAPGAQGTDSNIADALQPLDFWKEPVFQDMTNGLWATLARRYKNDGRIALYDLVNEPNNVPGGNPPIQAMLERLINTVRGEGDQHLLLLEGNGYGNNYNAIEKRTFTHQENLVYNSHRYSILPKYPLSNALDATNPDANQLGAIANLLRFRETQNVPVWVGETGENSAQWMGEAARNLNSVGIGWCQWTYKRFNDKPIAALLRIKPPYIVDVKSAAELPQILENIKFQNCLPNPDVIAALKAELKK
ncbi:glycoside hydrolase family 5 protein [Hymenobacter convexus]|uniref:glycoside hydrolase family 5 protein n=1 Tax=Hymenobacter sp. CA1UV-4 TaxID=3063782 RepID=UPI002713AA9F|nr:cellulase family glycosylhydrolase [Hymenobacter sp. CA1UV-4]MDO7849982.1 cellulase family glycosylhydrolase [Hymenobacter sp. CA1UV-4]